MNDDARLEALEFKVAHLEQANQELGEVLIAQQRELAQLAAKLQHLGDRVTALGEPGGASATTVEIPPHY
jgi:uncharacterized coiled-coil protein SlyX